MQGCKLPKAPTLVFPLEGWGAARPENHEWAIKEYVRGLLLKGCGIEVFQLVMKNIQKVKV